MSNSMDRAEMIVLKLVAALFIFISLIYILFISSNYAFIIGLTIGTCLSILKFKINIISFTKTLTAAKEGSKIPSKGALSLYNILLLIVFSLIIYLFLNKIKIVDIYTITGLFIGIGLIPAAILIMEVLKLLYIIRK